MFIKYIIIFVLAVLALNVLCTYVGLIKNNIDDTSEYTCHKMFYKPFSSAWFKITAGGTYSAVLVIITVIFGLTTFFIGFQAGVKLTKRKILSSIVIAVLIGIGARSFNFFFKLKLMELLMIILPNDAILTAASIADGITYVIWMIFIAGIAVYVYETLIVTAKEVHPMQ